MWQALRWMGHRQGWIATALCVAGSDACVGTLRALQSRGLLQAEGLGTAELLRISAYGREVLAVSPETTHAA